MAKKLLVIFGIAAIAGYLFRDRLIAGALDLGGKLNQFTKEVEERAMELRGDGADFVGSYKSKDE